MRILLLGGTGRTGKHVMREAVARGHDLTAMTRNAGSLGEHVRVVAGDPRDKASVATAAKDAEAVISCLGQRSRADCALLSDSAEAVLEALRGRPEVPFLVLSQGLLFPSRNPVIALLRLALRRHVRDSRGMETRLLKSHAAWEIVRPPRLRDGGASRGFVVAEGRLPSGPGSMERVDLARFLVDEAEARRHLCRIVGIAANGG